MSGALRDCFIGQLAQEAIFRSCPTPVSGIRFWKFEFSPANFDRFESAAQPPRNFLVRQFAK